MILLLLCPLLLTGVQSQTASVAEEGRSRAERNGTFSRENVTSSLSPAETSLTEDQLENNNQSSVVWEDDETFMDQDRTLWPRPCDPLLLVQNIQLHCGDAFDRDMLQISSVNWCHLEDISRPYKVLSLCLEWLSGVAGCFYPNSNTEDFFLDVHHQYFHNCSKEELVLEDAPHWLVMVLTLVPVSLIPVLVYLVVWKSKVQE